MVLSTGFLLQGALIAVLPEEGIILTLGFLWGHGRVDFGAAFFSVLLGLLPANALMVTLGRRFGSRLFQRRPFCWLLAPHALQKATRLLKNHGLKLAFVTRFVPSVRAPVYAAIGISGIRIRNFMMIDFCAACIHVPLLLYLRKHTSTHSGTILSIALGAAAAVIFLSGLLFIKKRLKARFGAGETPRPVESTFLTPSAQHDLEPQSAHS